MGFNSNNRSQILSLNQQSLGPLLMSELLSDSAEVLKSVEHVISIFTGVFEHLEVILDEVATLGDILSCFHLVTCQHPHLDVCIGEGVLARMRSRMVSGTSSCNRSSTAVAPIKNTFCYN